MRPASAPPTSSSSGLPRALLQAGKLSQQQVDTIQRNASEERIPFIDAVIRSGELDAGSMALFCATHFGCPLLDLGAVDIQALPKQVIDDRLMQSQRVVVLAKRASKVSVAIADPTQTLA
ncbi:MAG: type IV-A pilus assembly ATPase PilB, partial [Oxalobacteraceae bacterium]|nr:type IV-A pilus assembly ATPase PilB [Oxalobacteraceae bacterium]